MHNFPQRLIEHWQRNKTPILPGVSPADIAQFEASQRVRLPADLRAYFEAVDGTEEMGTDSFRFWSLAAFKRVEDVFGKIIPNRFVYPNCFVFADSFVECFHYAVTLGSGSERSGPVYEVGCDNLPWDQKAASFQEYMELYLADPDRAV